MCKEWRVSDILMSFELLEKVLFKNDMKQPTVKINNQKVHLKWNQEANKRELTHTQYTLDL